MGTLRSLVCGALLLANSLAFGLGERVDTTYFELRAKLKFLGLPVISKAIYGYLTLNSAGEPNGSFYDVPGVHVLGIINIDHTQYKRENVRGVSEVEKRVFLKDSCLFRSKSFSPEGRGKDALYLLEKFMGMNTEGKYEQIKAEYPLALGIGDTLTFVDSTYFGRINERGKLNRLNLDVYSEKIPDCFNPRMITLSFRRFAKDSLTLEGVGATVWGIPVKAHYKVFNKRPN